MKVRVKFSKRGNIKYVGHLDIMRYFQKAIRRAGLPVKYSEGFSPHQIMSFSAPLGTALESDSEYMDLELTENIPAEELCRKLEKEMCDGIHIIKAVELNDKARSSMAVMESADFVIVTEDGRDYSDMISELMARTEVMHEKTSKKTGEVRQENIRPMIYELKYDDGKIFMHIAQGSNGNLNPKAVMDVLGIDFNDCTIIRREMYGPDHVSMEDIKD